MSKEDKLDVYDIKLEIARRIEHHTASAEADRLVVQGVVQGLDSLWKWIQQQQEEDK